MDGFVDFGVLGWDRAEAVFSGTEYWAVGGNFIIFISDPAEIRRFWNQNGYAYLSAWLDEEGPCIITDHGTLFIKDYKEDA